MNFYVWYNPRFDVLITATAQEFSEFYYAMVKNDWFYIGEL